MAHKTHFRLVAMMRLLLLLILPSAAGPATRTQTFTPCTDCARACVHEYLECLEQGQAGCEIVAAACHADCPCP